MSFLPTRVLMLVSCLSLNAVAAELDPDGNGLYDDAERKVLLDAILETCPEMRESLAAEVAPVGKAASNNPEDFSEAAPAQTQAAPAQPAGFQGFDLNGDGRVTLEEESEGRHPLGLLVPRGIVEKERKFPWAIDLFAEWISTAYLREDFGGGDAAVGRLAGRGSVPVEALQVDTTLQPRATAEGLEFAADSGRHLTMAGQRDARWNYRWCVMTFRIDAASGTGKETVLLDLNSGKGSNRSSPKVWFSKEEGLGIQYVGLNAGGLDKRVMRARNVVADGKSWNVLVCGIRYGRLFASVNGVALEAESPQPPRFSGEWPPQEGLVSHIGDRSPENMAWGLDALVFGLTEPSEAMVRKLSGWAAHRLGFQGRLPEGDPYRERRPVLDAEDFPVRYNHDDPEWNAWGAALKTERERNRANAGGSRAEPQGFERVFYDDFRADRLKASTSGEGDLWVGPGFNTAVGGSAPLLTPGKEKEPAVYIHDAAQGWQTLSLAAKGDRWFGSAVYTVNDLGQGYTWRGPKVIRIRCRFPKLAREEVAGGLFPAFWSYAPENMVWRTSNRIEVDWFEFDGKNPLYYNGLSSHVHYPYLRQNNVFARNTGSYKRYKVYGGELTEEKSRIPGGINIWDGVFHTWEFVVDADWTYVNVTVPAGEGADKWVEVVRCPTPAIYLEALDLQLDYALKGKQGTPKDGARQDFTVDFVEVLQKTAALEVVPPVFKERPRLVAEDGSVRCEAPLAEGVTDVRYFWFADGYPLGYGAEPTLAVPASDAGKAIRCMVKAVGARDMPEAWSAALR